LVSLWYLRVQDILANEPQATLGEFDNDNIVKVATSDPTPLTP
jgi:hypothetical protein